MECNRHLKFGSLLDKALTLGFDFLATGHYAAIEKNENGLLSKKTERTKERIRHIFSTPFLMRDWEIFYSLSPHLTKDEVRDLAKKTSLPVAEKQESQDICFVTQKNCQDFLLERGQELKPGPIVDLRGKILGKHRGIIFHTIGQRGGLGISHPTPLYVLSIDPVKNRIVVGEKKDLMGKGLVANDVNMLSEQWPKEVYAKIRYRKKEALCEVTKEKDKLKVIFAEEQEAITPGQSVVFYDYDRVLGGGIINEVLHGTD